MKTNKISTYLLLGAACAVWGAIAYRLLRTAPALQPPVRTLRPRAASTAGIPQMPELEYPDPFLKEISPDNSPRPQSVSQTSGKLAVRKPQKENISLVYRGKITKNNIRYYLLIIDGASCILRPGDTVRGFKLLPPAGDSLTLVKGGNAYRTKAGE